MREERGEEREREKKSLAPRLKEEEVHVLLLPPRRVFHAPRSREDVRPRTCIAHSHVPTMYVCKSILAHTRRRTRERVREAAKDRTTARGAALSVSLSLVRRSAGVVAAAPRSSNALLQESARSLSRRHTLILLRVCLCLSLSMTRRRRITARESCATLRLFRIV